MANNRRRSAEPRPARADGGAPLERYRGYLVIDKDDLGDCLVKQPELYYHVAEAYAMAVAERDSIKLASEEAEAEESRRIRELAFKRDEKLTEASLTQQLKLVPRLQELQRDMLIAKAEVDKWGALKEAYQQRSYMLRELVPMYPSRLQGTSFEARDAVAYTHRRLAGEERMRRRFSGG